MFIYTTASLCVEHNILVLHIQEPILPGRASGSGEYAIILRKCSTYTHRIDDPLKCLESSSDREDLLFCVSNFFKLWRENTWKLMNHLANEAL